MKKNIKLGPKYKIIQTPDVEYHNSLRKIFYMYQNNKIDKQEYNIEKLKLKIVRDSKRLEQIEVNNNG